LLQGVGQVVGAEVGMPAVEYGSRVCGLHAGDRLIEGLPEDDEEVIVDLTAAEFVDPSGMVSFTTACLEAIGMGNNLAVLAPANRNVANYLLRMRFRDLLRDESVRFPGGFGSWEVSRGPLADQLLELQAVTTREAAALGEHLFAIGRGAGVPDAVLRPAFLGLAEGVDNTLQHSETERAIVMAQRYRAHDGGRLRVEVAVGDIGIGLRRSLRRTRPVATDAAAVALAVTKGVSRFTGSRHGNGLSSVVEAVCGSGGGAFEIRSGNASMLIQRTRRPQRHSLQRDGVLIGIRVTAPG
jgi:hypothetical protein